MSNLPVFIFNFHVNADKSEYVCFNQISTLNDSSLKLVNKSTYLGSSVLSTEIDISMWLAKAWTAIDRLSFIWKSDLTGENKMQILQAAVVLILLYGCTTWTLTKHILDGNYTGMLPAILNNSWKKYPTKQLPLIRKTLQVVRTRHVRHCWKSKDELICDILLWTPSHGLAKAGRLARTYTEPLCRYRKLPWRPTGTNGR